MSKNNRSNAGSRTERLEAPNPARSSKASGTSSPRPPASSRPKKLSLSMVNAAEDIPRLIRVVGKVGKAQCAMVLRPHDGRALLVRAENGEAWYWTGSESDVVRRPETPISIEDSITMLKQAQRSPGAQGPISLRGKWSGKFICDNGQPRVTLVRKVASYGILHIQSDPSSGKWSWYIQRTEKWYSRPAEEQGSAKSLIEAIRTGLGNAMRLLGEACSIRDSRRRAAMDPEYAEKHPIRPAKEGKDPTERYNPKEKKPKAALGTGASASGAGSKTATTGKAAPASEGAGAKEPRTTSGRSKSTGQPANAQKRNGGNGKNGKGEEVNGTSGNGRSGNGNAGNGGKTGNGSKTGNGGQSGGGAENGKAGGGKTGNGSKTGNGGRTGNGSRTDSGGQSSGGAGNGKAGNGKTTASGNGRGRGTGRKGAVRPAAVGTAAPQTAASSVSASAGVLAAAAQSTSPATGATEIDPAKDTMLMDAFSQALTQVIAQMGGTQPTPIG